MLMFYHRKGIPDDPWFISPGKEGQSVQYLPNFEEKHFWYKSQFDYYADYSTTKLFLHGIRLVTCSMLPTALKSKGLALAQYISI